MQKVLTDNFDLACRYPFRILSSLVNDIAEIDNKISLLQEIKAIKETFYNEDQGEEDNGEESVW